MTGAILNDSRTDRLLPILAVLLCLASWACDTPADRSGEDGATSSSAAAATPAGGPKRHVLLILLDAARADRFSCYGYPTPTTPEMDRLAAEGVVFLNHFAQGTGTRESIPSLLYSRYFTPPLFPNDPRVPYARPDELFSRPDAEQVSLPGAFEAAGFVTGAISAHIWMGEKTAFAGEFQEMRDLTRLFSTEKYPYPRASKVVDEAIRWIGRNRDRDSFLYLHLMDTHYPHYFEEEARELFGAATYDASHFSASGSQTVPSESLTERDLDYVDALYDGSLRHVDRHLGRLFASLRDEGLLEHTTVAVTSDHGEYLRDGPGGRPRDGKRVFAHGGPAFDPLARIPLILYSPAHLAPARYEGFSEGVDVGPTLLRLAGVSLPEGKTFDGVDLGYLAAGRIPAKEEVVMHQTVRTARHKAIFATPDLRLLAAAAPDPASLEGQLFDLTADPGELTDRFADSPDIVAGLLDRYRKVLEAPFRRSRAARSGAQPTDGFAISSKFVASDPELRQLVGGAVPRGWSLMQGVPHSAMVARGTGEPVEVRFPVPDGDYQLSFGMNGAAAVEIDGEAREVASNRNMGGYGLMRVTGATFRAKITPRGDLRIFFFGFLPEGIRRDTAEDEERLKKLRSLGYVE